MHQTASKITRVVRLMKDPDPRFVSWVDHGANQTPFRALKRAAPTPKDGVISQKEADIMPGQANTTVPESEASIRSFAFKKANFPDEASVKKWLKAGNWEGFVITDKGANWYVSGEDVDDDMFSELRVLKMDEGVVVNAGTLKETLDEMQANDDKPLGGATQDGAAENQTQAAKRIASTTRLKPPPNSRVTKTVDFVTGLTKKWDWWESYSSSEMDLNGLVKAAMEDGIPPGMCQIMDAATTAIGNVLKTDVLDSGGKSAALNTIGTQMGSIIYKMYQVFESLEGATTKSAAVKDWVDETRNYIDTQKLNTNGDNVSQGTLPAGTASDNTPNNDGGALDPNNTDDKIPLPDNGTGQPNPAQPAAPMNVKNNEVSQDRLAELILATVGKALKPITDSVEKVSKRLDEIDEKVEVAKAATETFARRAPTKKGVVTAGADEQVPDPEAAKKAAKEEEAAKKFENRVRRGLLGI